MRTSSISPTAFIRIQSADRQLFTLPLTPRTTVLEIKQAISQRSKIKPEFQILAFGNLPLKDDTQLLTHIGVVEGDTLKLNQLYDPSENSIPVTVTSGSANIVIYCRPGASIEDFQRQVSEECQSRGNFELEFNGTVLEPGRQVRDYGIQPNSLVHLVERLEGG